MGEWGAGQHDGEGGYPGEMGLETREEAEEEVKSSFANLKLTPQ